MRTRLTEMLRLEYALIMAPMFLVSNTAMVIEGMAGGVAGRIPALNPRTLEELGLFHNGLGLNRNTFDSVHS
jgi:nitronate monooxygenase